MLLLFGVCWDVCYLTCNRFRNVFRCNRRHKRNDLDRCIFLDSSRVRDKLLIKKRFPISYFYRNHFLFFFFFLPNYSKIDFSLRDTYVHCKILPDIRCDIDIGRRRSFRLCNEPCICRSRHDRRHFRSR